MEVERAGDPERDLVLDASEARREAASTRRPRDPCRAAVRRGRVRALEREQGEHDDRRPQSEERVDRGRRARSRPGASARDRDEEHERRERRAPGRRRGDRASRAGSRRLRSAADGLVRRLARLREARRARARGRRSLPPSSSMSTACCENLARVKRSVRRPTARCARLERAEDALAGTRPTSPPRGAGCRSRASTRSSRAYAAMIARRGSASARRSSSVSSSTSGELSSMSASRSDARRAARASLGDDVRDDRGAATRHDDDGDRDPRNARLVRALSVGRVASVGTGVSLGERRSRPPAAARRLNSHLLRRQ